MKLLAEALLVAALASCAREPTRVAPVRPRDSLIARPSSDTADGGSALIASPEPAPVDFSWHSIAARYYDPASFVEVSFGGRGTQARYVGTCQKVCKDLGLEARPQCVGWSAAAYGLACRRTGTADSVDSAGPSCEETNFYSIIGRDSCCCGSDRDPRAR